MSANSEQVVADLVATLKTKSQKGMLNQNRGSWFTVRQAPYDATLELRFPGRPTVKVRIETEPFGIAT